MFCMMCMLCWFVVSRRLPGRAACTRGGPCKGGARWRVKVVHPPSALVSTVAFCHSLLPAGRPRAGRRAGHQVKHSPVGFGTGQGAGCTAGPHLASPLAALLRWEGGGRHLTAPPRASPHRPAHPMMCRSPPPPGSPSLQPHVRPRQDEPGGEPDQLHRVCGGAAVRAGGPGCGAERLPRGAAPAACAGLHAAGGGQLRRTRCAFDPLIAQHSAPSALVLGLPINAPWLMFSIDHHSFHFVFLLLLNRSSRSSRSWARPWTT